MYVPSSATHTGNARSATDQRQLPTMADLLDPLGRYRAYPHYMGGDPHQTASCQCRNWCGAPLPAGVRLPTKGWCGTVKQDCRDCADPIGST
jgi:hypothetical protein